MNGIEFPRRLQPGSRLRVPMKWIRSNPVPARLAMLGGKAELTRADGSVDNALAPGTTFQLGDTLKTGADSSAAITFADGTVLTLHSDSRMRFDQLSAHGETGMVDSRLHLIEGRLDTRVKPAVGPGSRFEIQTPSAISAVRGTEYRAAVTAEGQSSNIEVVEGTVRVAGSGRARLVDTGHGTQVAVGKPPTPPRRLLPPPVLDPVPERIRQLNWPLVWTAVHGASAYRVEIATADAPDVIRWEQVIPRSRLALPDLPDRRYEIRIRGTDARGLEGLNTRQPLILDVRPQAPVPLHPQDKQTLRGETAALQWTASEDAAQYRLEIASDPTFERVILAQGELGGTRFATDAIAQPGSYHWRVASIAPDGETGPWSAPRSWQLKPVPEKPEPTLAASEDGLVASWPQASPGQTFQVQIAYDNGFKDIALDETVARPSIAIGQLTGQVRYLRVRSLEPDGYRGPWGAVQRIDPAPDPSVWLVPALGIIGIILLWVTGQYARTRDQNRRRPACRCPGHTRLCTRQQHDPAAHRLPDLRLFPQLAGQAGQ